MKEVLIKNHEKFGELLKNNLNKIIESNEDLGVIEGCVNKDTVFHRLTSGESVLVSENVAWGYNGGGPSRLCFDLIAYLVNKVCKFGKEGELLTESTVVYSDVLTLITTLNSEANFTLPVNQLIDILAESYTSERYKDNLDRYINHHATLVSKGNFDTLENKSKEVFLLCGKVREGLSKDSIIQISDELSFKGKYLGEGIYNIVFKKGGAYIRDISEPELRYGDNSPWNKEVARSILTQYLSHLQDEIGVYPMEILEYTDICRYIENKLLSKLEDKEPYTIPGYKIHGAINRFLKDIKEEDIY